MVLRLSCSASCDELRIDEEHHRHLALLAGLEALLGEAEAVDLGEIGADGRRRHVVGRVADDLARGFVDHDVVHGQHVADPDLDEALLRHEPPGQPAGHIGVEPHDDLAVEHLARRGRGQHAACRQSRWCGRTSRRAAPRRRPCPPSPPRTRRRRPRPGGRAGGGCDRVAGSGSSRVAHSGRFSTAGPLTSVMT